MLKARMSRWTAYQDLPMSEAAARLGVSAQTLSRWVNGHMRPKPRQMGALAELLGLDHDTVREWFDDRGRSHEARDSSFMRKLKKALAVSELTDNECGQVMYLVVKILDKGTIPSIEVVDAMTGVFLPMYRDDVFEIGEPPAMTLSFNEGALLAWLRDRRASNNETAL